MLTVLWATLQWGSSSTVGDVFTLLAPSLRVLKLYEAEHEEASVALSHKLRDIELSRVDLDVGAYLLLVLWGADRPNKLNSTRHTHILSRPRSTAALPAESACAAGPTPGVSKDIRWSVEGNSGWPRRWNQHHEVSQNLAFVVTQKGLNSLILQALKVCAL
jgi:hypothetical protein